jgi:hypothetical protein
VTPGAGVRIHMRPTVSRPVRLGVGPPLGPMTRFYTFFSPTSSCRAPSLTRGRVCILQCTSLTSQSREGPYYCLIRDFSNLVGHVPIFISPRNRVAQLYPQTLGHLFIASYDSHGYGGGIVTALHTGITPGAPDGRSLIRCQVAGRDPTEVGAAELRTDWLVDRSP